MERHVSLLLSIKLSIKLSTKFSEEKDKGFDENPRNNAIRSMYVWPVFQEKHMKDAR